MMMFIYRARIDRYDLLCFQNPSAEKIGGAPSESGGLLMG